MRRSTLLVTLLVLVTCSIPLNAEGEDTLGRALAPEEAQAIQTALGDSVADAGQSVSVLWPDGTWKTLSIERVVRFPSGSMVPKSVPQVMRFTSIFYTKLDNEPVAILNVTGPPNTQFNVETSLQLQRWQPLTLDGVSRKFDAHGRHQFMAYTFFWHQYFRTRR